MNNIEKKWEDYLLTLPKNPAPMQVLEARLGFFSGATAMFFMMMGKAMDEEVSEEEGQQFLTDLSEEVHRFIDDVLTKDQAYFTKGEANAS